MSKRYMFWRRPDGGLNRAQAPDDKHAPTVILERIGRAAEVMPDDRVTLGTGHHEFSTALELCVAFEEEKGSELNGRDSSKILRRSLAEAIRKKRGGQPLRPADLQDAADKEAAAFFRSRKVRYALVTSLSVRQLPAKEMRVGGLQIRRLPSRERYPLPSSVWQPGVAPPATDYQLVRVGTEGRSHFEAADRALRSVALLRAMWTLAATYRAWRMSFGSPSRPPLAAVHTGPIHTLHLPRGRLATEDFWYERWGREKRKLFAPSSWKDIERARRRWLRMLASHRFGSDIESLLALYIEAKDQPNHDLAFLWLWSLLERITGTGGMNYDATIKRAVWVYQGENRAIATEILKSARTRRNRYVHASRSAGDAEQASYLIKSLLDPHLVFLLENYFGLGSLEEYGAFLSLPTKVEELERKASWIRKAIQHHD